MKTKGISKYTKALCLLAVTIIFSLLTYFVDRQPVGYEGTSVGFATLNSAFSKAFGYNAVMSVISNIAMYFSFLVVAGFAAIGIMQLVKTKSLSKVSKTIIGLGVLYVIVAILYVAFKKIPINYRPILKPGETEIETSFPSTHTLVIASVLGSGIIAAKRLFANKNTVKVLRVLFTVVMVVGVVARLFSGVHWVTDIIAGILFSATLIAFYAAWGLN